MPVGARLRASTISLLFLESNLLVSKAQSASPSSRRVESKRAHLSPAVLFQRSKVSDVWVLRERLEWFGSFLLTMIFWNDSRMLTGGGGDWERTRERKDIAKCSDVCYAVWMFAFRGRTAANKLFANSLSSWWTYVCTYRAPLPRASRERSGEPPRPTTLGTCLCSLVSSSLVSSSLV